MRAIMSVLAMYQYDETLFDGLQIPAGLDRSGLINELCMQLGELNTIISDPEVMKAAITEWSKTKAAIWDHLFETTQYEYNPIWNKDGVYKETETRDLKSKADAEALNQVTGYNSDTMRDAEKTTSKGNGEDTGTITREREEHGNIGVTTTQQMIREEREVADYSLYQLIIDDFKMRFCIMVY